MVSGFSFCIRPKENANRLDQGLNSSHRFHFISTITITLSVPPLCVHVYIVDHSRGWPEGSLFDSYLHQGVGEGATPCWLTLVEGDPKAPFSIAITQRCKGGRYSLLWITPLTLDPYLITLTGLNPGLYDH